MNLLLRILCSRSFKTCTSITNTTKNPICGLYLLLWPVCYTSGVLDGGQGVGVYGTDPVVCVQLTPQDFTLWS